MPARRKPNVRAAQRALADLLRAAGCDLRGELRATPARAARLWIDHLLAGEHADLQAILSGGSATRSRAAVALCDVAVHLVCPHHLTVAFGTAHLAYAPGGRIAGLGALTRLLQASTARLVLQEDAAHDIAEALVNHLGARAAVSLIEARHPCHAVPHGHAHAARTVTWGESGEPRAIARLRTVLAQAVRR